MSNIASERIIELAAIGRQTDRLKHDVSDLGLVIRESLDWHTVWPAVYEEEKEDLSVLASYIKVIGNLSI